MTIYAIKVEISHSEILHSFPHSLKENAMLITSNRPQLFLPTSWFITHDQGSGSMFIHSP